MNPQRNKDKASNSKKSLLKGFSLKFVVYIFLAFIVFVVSKASWWAGLILFLIFAAYILVEFVTYGFIVTIAVFTVFLSATKYSKLNSINQDILSKKGYDLLLINLLYATFCLSLLILTGSLFVLLFKDSFANYLT